MPEFIENILIGIRQWVNGKIEELSFVISSHINELYRVKEDKKVPTPLCFTALETGVTIGITNSGGATPNIEISIDNKQTWTTWDYSNVSLDNTEDGKVYLRGMNTDGFSESFSKYSKFTMSGGIAASGNIMSLIDYTQDVDTIPRDSCYYNMFYGCSGLTTAPELPATTLADGCYYYMFLGCTSLTTAPELPATTLANGCYGGMFFNCTSLDTAPVLPATTLASSCYSNMFRGCTSLTTVPELPATTLANNCYSGMFYGCTSLNTTPELPATTLSQGCYNSMFYGCTSLTNVSELPATTLAVSCYYGMFSHCSNLTTAPELPAITLASSCYQDMFNGCTSLNYIKCLATNISATGCTSHWVSGVTSTGTFVKESTMTGWPLDDVSGIPSGWTVYNHYTDVELDKKLQQITNLLNQQ